MPKWKPDLTQKEHLELLRNMTVYAMLGCSVDTPETFAVNTVNILNHVIENPKFKIRLVDDKTNEEFNYHTGEDSNDK